MSTTGHTTTSSTSISTTELSKFEPRPHHRRPATHPPSSATGSATAPAAPLTKIVCTLGPASADERTLTSLIQSGMNVARINFSHGDHEEHRGRFDLVRRVAASLQKPVAIMVSWVDGWMDG